MRYFKHSTFGYGIIILLLLNVLPQHLLAQNIEDSPWQITATDTTNYAGISMANGRIGLLPSMKPFTVSSIILNNVFDKGSKRGVSRILRGLNFAVLDMTIDGDKVDKNNISHWKQVLNMKEASITTSFSFKKKANISYTLYALRGLPYSGLMKVNVEALKDIEVTVAGKILCPVEDKNPSNSYKVYVDLESKMPLLQTTATSPFGKYMLASTASFVFKEEHPELHHKVVSNRDNELMFNKKIKKRESYSFGWTGATCTTHDFNDPLSESARMVIFVMQGNEDAVISTHKALWLKLWQGDIEIEGDLQSQRDVRLALFNLYSFGRANSGLSIPPMGLSSQGYNGHIFWDSELWMYPAMLVFNQDIAKSMMNYRFNRLEKAKQKAANFGYNGAMFPWESDDTGEEACPVFALTGTFEQHITADVGIAFWNYYRITRDKQWLKNKAYPLLKEVADFWVSRTTINDDGSYSINNVVGANEFAQNIDDNAFTNGSAKCVLEYATRAAKTLNIKPDSTWMVVANNLRFMKMPNGVTKENATYHGQIIKQADVNLLAYPLGVIKDRKQIIKDLNYYEGKISKEGPAMGYSILSILHAQLGDNKKAFELFKRAYMPNKRPPFGALSESATSNNPYFATGAGGMLQAVLFGFGGLQITDDGLVEGKPCLPKQWKSLTIKGVGSHHKTYTIKH